MNEAYQSETFINPLGMSKSYGQNDANSVFVNKIMLRNNNGINKSSKEVAPEHIAKRSVQLLMGLNNTANKTQYSKINRRK